MDGYAVRSGEVAAASGGAESCMLPVSQRIPAGSAAQPLAPGTAARIFAVDEFAGVTDEASFDAIWSEDDAKPVDPDAGGTELAPLEDEPDAGGSVMESFRV